MMQIPDITPVRLDCDVLVIGGGTAGTMAALSAAEAGARVLLLEKAHVRHSGALAMGKDVVAASPPMTKERRDSTRGER